MGVLSRFGGRNGRACGQAFYQTMCRAIYRALAIRPVRWFAVGGLLLCIALLVLDMLFPPRVPAADARGALLVVAREGTPLRAFPDREHIWRHFITLDQVSPRYLEALVQYEDRNFWWHPGVNPAALLRAAWQWHQTGNIVSGGSTLTMQVARILEPIPRTPTGKLWQIARALQLEWHYSKQEILTLYINHAPMGGVLEGVEAASRAYLGKPSRRLSHAEAALLAVLPQAPSLYRPDRHPERARVARDKLLQRMTGVWSEETIQDAVTEPPYAQKIREPLMAPLLAERLKKTLGTRGAVNGVIQSTIDPQAQQSVELLLMERTSMLPARVSIAALVVDNARLEVRAYAGSADFADQERFSHVDMVQASRSPGSTLKPFLYGFALDEGLIHSESLLSDAPQSFSGYQPGNFQQSFHGPVSVSEALVKSLNVPAVEVLERLEPGHFVALLRRGGLHLDLPQGASPNLSVILGGAGTSLEGLVGAYTALARNGLAGQPRFTPDAPLKEQRMLSAGAAFVIRDLLESGGPMGRVLETGAGQSRGIAWKTGTSFGFRDAWSIGVSDQFTVGVWVGRPDGTPNPGFFGANIAAPLLVDIFDALDTGERKPADRAPPAEAHIEKICWPLGLRQSATSTETCHSSRSAWVLNGVAPPTFPDRLRRGGALYQIQIDPVTGLRATADCFEGPLQAREIARWPASLEPWLSPELKRKALPPAWHPACQYYSGPETGLKISGISDGEILHRTSQGGAPLIHLQVRGAQGEVIWLVNGKNMGRYPAARSFSYRLDSPGRYEITVMNDLGFYDRVSISMR